MRTSWLSCIVLASGGLFGAFHCLAKDWDYERAQYWTDTKVMELRGSVRSLTTHSYTDGSITLSDKSEFDRKGNLVRSVRIDSKSLCYETIYTNDANGNVLSTLTSDGGPRAGDVECQNQRPRDKTTYTYAFNKQGLPTSRKLRTRYLRPPNDISDSMTGYTYDSAGKLIRAEFSTGATVNFNEYSYGSDPRGMRVRKHMYYKSDAVTFDVIRELLYAADGRLLEVTQSPPNVSGFGGNAVEVYDQAGRLLQEKAPRATTDYDGHDKHGNWTVSRVGSTRHVRSFVYY